jgi:hypothetical protein
MEQISETLFFDQTLMQLITSEYLITFFNTVYFIMLVKSVVLSNIPEVIIHCRAVVMVIS